MDGHKFQAFEKIDVAKKMVAENDYLGARSRLLEVHYQFPSFGNLAQMITACDILCAAELTLPGSEMDWYWVLQLSPTATVPQITLQKNKLSAVLEGIKEEFPVAAADTALKLVRDAFLVLSNKPKRLIFDSKRLTSWGSCDSFGSSVSSVDNTGSHSGKSLATSLGCESSVSRNTDAPNVSGGAAERCSTYIDLDEDLCEAGKISQDEDVHNSHDALCSTEVTSVALSSKSMPNDTVCPPDNNVTSTVDTCLGKPFPPLGATLGRRRDGVGTVPAEAFEFGQVWAVYDDENLPRKYARINSVSNSPFRLNFTWLQPVPETENEAKWCEVGLPVVCGLFNLHEDDNTVVECSAFSHLVSYTANPTYDEFQIHPQEDEVWVIYKDWKPVEWFEDPESRKGCTLEVIQVLCVKEEDDEPVVVAQPVKLDDSGNIDRSETEEGQESFEIPWSCLYRFSHHLQSPEMKDRDTNGDSCVVFQPDSQNNVLKAEWAATDFTSGQVWAIHCSPDQMPRQYVVVNYVVSSNIVSVTLLEPHPMHDEEIGWIEENLLPGCGIFKVGARTLTLHMSKFSHLVNCDRSSKQLFYRIHPRKGEVWAMYRNWNIKWKKQDFINSRCRIVQITSDFCENFGVQVASLEEVPGFKTFFQKQLSDGFALNRTVRRTEMLSFSHRIEAFVVPGVQVHGIPECSWHLEPDALPLVLSN